jgi:hypothetical protein
MRPIRTTPLTRNPQVQELERDQERPGQTAGNRLQPEKSRRNRQGHLVFSELDAEVGRTPRSAAGPPTGLAWKLSIPVFPKEADRGGATADRGARPTKTK